MAVLELTTGGVGSVASAVGPDADVDPSETVDDDDDNNGAAVVVDAVVVGFSACVVLVVVVPVVNPSLSIAFWTLSSRESS